MATGSVSVSFSFLLVIALAVYLGNGSAMPFIFAVAIHEISHIIAIFLCGYKIMSTQFRGNGIQINIVPNRYSRIMCDLIISFSGPFAGFIAALIFDMMGMKQHSAINLVLSLFNLLPVRGLDGGKILSEIVTAIIPEYAEDTCRTISWIVSFGLVFLGILIYRDSQSMAKIVLIAGIMLVFTMLSDIEPKIKHIN